MCRSAQHEARVAELQLSTWRVSLSYSSVRWHLAALARRGRQPEEHLGGGAALAASRQRAGQRGRLTGVVPAEEVLQGVPAAAHAHHHVPALQQPYEDGAAGDVVLALGHAAQLDVRHAVVATLAAGRRLLHHLLHLLIQEAALAAGVERGGGAAGGGAGHGTAGRGAAPVPGRGAGPGATRLSSARGHLQLVKPLPQLLSPLLGRQLLAAAARLQRHLDSDQLGAAALRSRDPGRRGSS